MAADPKLMQRADELYERYGVPLEAEHWGQFVAIAEDGGIIIGDDPSTVAREAEISPGPRSFVFKIGERAVGHMR